MKPIDRLSWDSEARHQQKDQMVLHYKSITSRIQESGTQTSTQKHTNTETLI